MGPEALTKQRILCVGAGSAGMGVVRMISKGMQVHGVSEAEANKNFWVLDEDGLITKARWVWNSLILSQIYVNHLCLVPEALAECRDCRKLLKRLHKLICPPD